MTAELRLIDLFIKMFTNEEARRFVKTLPKSDSLIAHLPAVTISQAIYMDGLVDALRRRGMVNHDFFKKLVAERGHWRKDINAISADFIAERGEDDGILKQYPEGILPASYVSHPRRLPGEVFFIELLRDSIDIIRDRAGSIEVHIRRQGVQEACVTGAGKRCLVEKYVAPRRVELAQADAIIQTFLSGMPIDRGELVPCLAFREDDRRQVLTLNLRDFPMRWASGGVFVLAEKQGETWAPFLFRDIQPVGWNNPLGASERHIEHNEVRGDLEGELNHPDWALIREFLEEMLVLVGQPARAAEMEFRRFWFGTDFHRGIQEQSRLSQEFARRHVRLRQIHDGLAIDLPDNAALAPQRSSLRATGERTNVKLWVYDREGKKHFTDDVLVIFNLLELGIEVVKVVKFSLGADDVLLDGEILEHPDGVEELVRMPFGLLRRDYLEAAARQFRGGVEYFEDEAVPAVKAPPIPPEAYHLFAWDLEQRHQRLHHPDALVSERERDRYRKWYDKPFRGQLIGGDGRVRVETPPARFTPTAAKLITLLLGQRA